jgi:hypothetical protein
MLIEHGEKLIAVEIKSGQTVNKDYFLSLQKWMKYSGSLPEQHYIIYKERFKSGDLNQLKCSIKKRPTI